MRKRMIVLAAFIMLFTGCGIQAEEKTDVFFFFGRTERVFSSGNRCYSFFGRFGKR